MQNVRRLTARSRGQVVQSLRFGNSEDLYPGEDSRSHMGAKRQTQWSGQKRRFGWIFTVLLATSPAWAAQNITVEQLKALLTTDQQAKKTDADVANDLKQVVLTEELTTTVMNDFAPLVPGSATLEQIYVLEAKSAVLPPPASDIPTAPAPDAATQKALLDKAMDYASKTYAQLPAVTATKTTIRFQDSVSATAVPGNHSGITADPQNKKDHKT